VISSFLVANEGLIVLFVFCLLLVANVFAIDFIAASALARVLCSFAVD